jgi:hypothetical protein
MVDNDVLELYLDAIQTAAAASALLAVIAAVAAAVVPAAEAGAGPQDIGILLSTDALGY